MVCLMKNTNGESYFDKCEREDQEKKDSWYAGFVAYRASEQAKEAEEHRYYTRLASIGIAVMVLLMIAIVVAQLNIVR